MAVDRNAFKSRRAVLAAALGGLGALLAGALGRADEAEAAQGGNALIGVANTGTAETSFENTDGGEVSLKGIQASGIGVKGQSTDSTPSTFVGTSHRNGVFATVGSESGVFANTDEAGVYGFADLSDSSVGVVGHTNQGWGVIGIGAAGVAGFGAWGVFGSADTDQIGVYGNTGASPAPSVAGGIGVLARAESSSQLALSVVGRSQFSQSGRLTILSGKSSRTVSKPGVTPTSWIIATPQTNRSGVFVQAAVPGNGAFTVYLNKAVSGNTVVGYLVIN
ncbi:MAG: hypothetical protein E6I45_04910 [Chloroflexi bacterium]|nr:MAG: hypothetical protein E6I45_04910 [Chloroflexota bacterium]